jgi:hypothetical protein
MRMSSSGLIPLPPEARLTEFWEEHQLLKDRVTVLEANIFPVFHTAPDKLVEGMVRVADGTDWDPGSGAGIYLYLGGSWTKL